MKKKGFGLRKFGRGAFFLLLAAIIITSSLAQLSPPLTTAAQSDVVITLGASRDNTLYESTTGATSNGAGSYFFAGQTNTGETRRGVIAFDLAGSIPTGSTINSVTLTLNMSRTQVGSTSVSLHRLLANWGEGTSNADAEEGTGAPSTTNDATWIHTFYSGAMWGTAGSDFTAATSASVAVSGVGSYTWGSTSQMVADVQGWLNNPATNYGWLVMGNEAANQTAKRFDSSENASSGNRPSLMISYTPPQGPTNTPTNTSTPTATMIATNTATNTPIASPTNTPTFTPTGGPTNTPTDTPTFTPTGGPTNTPTDTPTSTPIGSATPTATLPPPGGEPLEDPIPSPIPLGDITIRLIPVAQGLTAPNWGVPAPGICQRKIPRMFITDQDGIIWNLNLRRNQRTVFLDVRNLLVPLGAFGPGTFDERGLLGLAFHPGYSENGLLYTYTSEPATGEADFSTIPPGTLPNHQSLVREWHVPDPCNRNSVVDPASSRELLRIDEPQFNHNGGALNFGPDGSLYIALGDGGQADDQGVGHSSQGNAQDTSNVLGSILRIDPQGSNSANGQYGIPSDNPFVGQAGYVPEIFAYGFRNPFRFSFDSETGAMWIGDVGQNDIEEVDVGVSGGNYGWNLKEGTFCFNPNGTEPGFVTNCAPGQVPPDLIDPVAQFDHDEGIAVIGGFVYHGKLVPALHGLYVFGDFDRPSPGRDGRLFYMDASGQVFEFGLDRRETLGLALLGFGVDPVGNLYVLANSTGTPFGETGVIYKISRVMRKTPRLHFR